MFVLLQSDRRSNRFFFLSQDFYVRILFILREQNGRTNGANFECNIMPETFEYADIILHKHKITYEFFEANFQ